MIAKKLNCRQAQWSFYFSRFNFTQGMCRLVVPSALMYNVNSVITVLQKVSSTTIFFEKEY
jgi:hypothetical protein